VSLADPDEPPGSPSPLAVASGFAVLCLVWGTTWSVIQVGLRGIPPFTGVSLRFALASALLYAIARARGVPIGRTARERGLWVANGMLAFTGSYGVVYWSEQWIPSGLAAVLFATYPLWVALLARALLPVEAATWREGIGILVGFCGVGVLFAEDFTALGGADVRRAAVVMLASPLAAALGTIAVKRWGGGIHPLSIASGSMAVSAVTTGAIALAVERGQDVVWNPSSIGALLYLALAGSALTFGLYYWLLSHRPAKRLALVSYVVPVVAVAIGTLRGEPLTAQVLAGAALVLGGATVVTRAPKR
jgi:drug/metabolite transporter (DMT)-like permease